MNALLWTLLVILISKAIGFIAYSCCESRFWRRAPAADGR